MFLRCKASRAARRHGKGGIGHNGNATVQTSVPSLAGPLSALMVLSIALVLPMGEPRRVASLGSTTWRSGEAESIASLVVASEQISSDLLWLTSSSL